MAGFDVSALADFNNELAGELLVKSVIAGSTAEYVTVKEGIKYKEPLNLQEIDLQIQDGFGCVTTESGSVTYTDINNYAVSYGLGATANTITTDGTILFSGSGAQASATQFILDNAKRLGSAIDGTLDEIVIAVKPLTSNLDIYRTLNFRQQT